MTREATVRIHTMGCGKNSVDAEVMAGIPVDEGYTLVPSGRADVAMLNTCGFIRAAKEESIGETLSLDEAIAHINRYGSHHTDAILTDSHVNAMRFLREVDSASVMVNASTRFADGFEYGLGARSASAPTSSTRAGRSAWKGSPR